MKIDFPKLIASVLVCQLAGIIGSFFTFDSVKTWYLTINKPFFTPPSWLFAPVWIILFTLMGISLYLIWVKKIDFLKKKTALIFFSVQLVLNTLWSVIFFGLKNPLVAFIEIIFLWFAIFLTAVKFYPLNKKASLLFVPYLLWVFFAALLNLFIILLN